MKATDPPIHLLTIQDRTLRTAQAIANFLGCSESHVRRTLATDPTCPVEKRAGRYFARREQLERWARVTVDNTDAA